MFFLLGITTTESPGLIAEAQKHLQHWNTCVWHYIVWQSTHLWGYCI